MNIIMISGKSMSGKDTFAKLLKEQYKEEALIIHFADLVKYYATTYFNWNGEKDSDGRYLLQFIGTDLMRSRYPTYWAEIVGKFIDAITETYRYTTIIIPDWRFINEYDTIKEYGQICGNNVISVRVNRYIDDKPFINPNMSEHQLTHVSECELDDFSFEWVIENRSTLEELKESALVLYNELSPKGDLYD